MNTWLLDLLNTNSRIIIPEFGAFIIKQKNPKIVVFNEFLRYNDGLLIDYVAIKENIGKDKAKDKVLDFVNNLNERINKGENVFLEGLGYLLKDDTGKIILTEKEEMQEKESKKSMTTEGKKTEKTEKKPTPVTEKIKPKQAPEEKKSIEFVEKKDEIELNIVEEKTEAMPKNNLTAENKTQSAEKAESVEKTQPVTETKIKEAAEKKDTVVLKKPEPIATVINKPPYQPTVNKNKTQIFVWIVLIILVNGLILGWFIFNDKIQGLFSNKKSEPIELVADDQLEDEVSAEENNIESEKIPEITDETVSEENQMNQETVQPEQNAITGEKKYYIIAGCFRDQNNANILVKELKTKGYNSEQFGKIGNLFAVSYGSYIDKTAANEELKKIRSSEQADAWIIYY